MSQYDDFDIVQEEQPSWYARPIVWVGVIVLLVAVAFVAGIAFSTANRRVASPTPTSVGEVALVTATITPPGDAVGSEGDVTGEATASPADASSEPSATPIESPTASPTLEATPTETPQPDCPTFVNDGLASLHEQAGGRDTLGCAQTDASVVWSAWEPFERGQMLWRSDTNRSYVFFQNGGWNVIDTSWDGSDVPSRGDPPPGLTAPERGFGFAWSTSDALFNALGWATQPERGFCALAQNFERGFLLQSDPAPSCTSENLYNYATEPGWQTLRLIATEARRGASGASNLPAPAANGSTPDDATASGSNELTIEDDLRLPEQGIFVAQPVGSPRLDGDVSEWRGAWSPIRTVSLGQDNWRDASDLSGDFQTAWSPSGIVLAVRVVDDAYRSGPNGTQMYRGDGLEVHFDRRLGTDFDESNISDDDYQIGISFGDNLTNLRAYRWLPYAIEEALRLEGAALRTENGYQIETLIPWRVFEVDGGDLERGQTFGFNVSINDNDADEPEQQTVVSASTARTTFDNPTQWGTLVLN